MREKARRYLLILLTLLLFIPTLPMSVVAESYEDLYTGAEIAEKTPDTDEDSGNIPQDSNQDDKQSGSDHNDETSQATKNEEEHSGTSADPEQNEENERIVETDLQSEIEVYATIDLSVDMNAAKTYSIQVEWLSDVTSDSLQVEIIGMRANGQDTIRGLVLTANKDWKDTVELPVYVQTGDAEPEIYISYNLVVTSALEGIEHSVRVNTSTFIISARLNAADMPPYADGKNANKANEPLIENQQNEAPDEMVIPYPTIRLQASFEGETLTKGMPVTITATIDGIPDGMNYTVQWRNDLNGEFQDVPGETGMSVIFIADELNVNCSWQLVLKVTLPETGAMTAPNS